MVGGHADLLEDFIATLIVNRHSDVSRVTEHWFYRRNTTVGLAFLCCFLPLTTTCSLCRSMCVPPPPPLLTGTLSGYLLRILADSTHRCSVGEQRERQRSQGCERPPWRHSSNLKYKTDRGQRVYMNNSAWYRSVNAFLFLFALIQHGHSNLYVMMLKEQVMVRLFLVQPVGKRDARQRPQRDGWGDGW